MCIEDEEGRERKKFRRWRELREKGKAEQNLKWW